MNMLQNKYCRILLRNIKCDLSLTYKKTLLGIIIKEKILSSGNGLIILITLYQMLSLMTARLRKVQWIENASHHSAAGNSGVVYGRK